MPKLRDGFKGQRSIVLPAFLIEELKNETLSKELYITDIGFYPIAKFHYRERTQKEAEQFILIYCMEGEGWFKLNNKEYKVSQYQFFILPKGEAHSYGSSSEFPWTVYWLHFNGALASFFAKGFNVPTNIYPDVTSRIEERIDLFEEIFHTLSKGYSRNNLYYTTTSLFHFLGSIKFLGEYRENKNIQDSAQEKIDEIIHFMRENTSRKLLLKELADHAGLSVSHFSLLFQKKTRQSPLKYFNQLKIQKACHYLDSTNMKVNQISLKMGYDDEFYFPRMFTKIMGISPSK